MNKEFSSSSLVIIANTHNPSLLSDYFLLTSGIISKESDIVKGTSILSPAFSQVNLTKDINITLDSNTLRITCPEGNKPFKIGKKYCESLKYIKGVAIGINFDVVLSDFNFEEWFATMNLFDESTCVEAKYVFKHSNVSISLMKNNNALVKFNFHYQLPKDIPLGDIKVDFLNESKNNKKLLDRFLAKSFN